MRVFWVGETTISKSSNLSFPFLSCCSISISQSLATFFHSQSQLQPLLFAMAFSSSLVAAIDAYTGLAPAAFFTILALMACVYHLLSAFFVYPDDEAAVKRSLAPQIPSTEEALVPPPEPVQLGDITLEELRAYDGSDPKKPLLMAIKGEVYDVSIGRYTFLCQSSFFPLPYASHSPFFFRCQQLIFFPFYLDTQKVRKHLTIYLYRNFQNEILF